MIDTHHSNATRKPASKEYRDNFDKINWKNDKFNWVDKDAEENKKLAKKANKHLRK